MVGATTRILASLLIVWNLPVLCEAQQVTPSFEELRERLPPGSEVTVTSMDGRETRGRVIRLSASTIELSAGTSFAQGEIRQVQHHTRGPLGNGALWGALVGTGIGAVMGIGASTGSSAPVNSSAAIPGGIALGAVLGTTTGLLVDFFRPEHHVVYRAPGDQVQFAPRISGVRVAFQF